MIKLVVTDMDGTLLDDNKELSPRFFEMEEALARRGILFCSASGRQYHTLAGQFGPAAARMLFLAENGTIAVHKGEILFTSELDRAAAHMLVREARKVRNAYVVLCGKNSAYIENTSEQFLVQVRHYYKKLEIVNDITKVDDAVLKVTLCDFADSEKNSYTHFKKYERDYKVAISGKLWLDVTNPGANKGVALAKIQQKFGISPDETLVFGDYLNDLEMMSAAKYSYAMKNAHPEILKAARFVTRYDNNNNGVIDVVNELCLG